jgi:hypothetical protein
MLARGCRGGMPAHLSLSGEERKTYSHSEPYRVWHFSAVPSAPSNVGYRGQTGRHMLIARFSHFDPTATSAQNFMLQSEAGFSPYQSDHLSRYDAASSAGNGRFVDTPEA